MVAAYESSQPSISGDASAIMMFEANKKSVGVTYLFWFLLGGVGGHRFYVGKTGSAVGQLLLSIVGWLTLLFGIGLFLLAGLGIWVIVDAFLIPGWIRNQNSLLAMQLGQRGQSSPSRSAS